MTDTERHAELPDRDQGGEGSSRGCHRAREHQARVTAMTRRALRPDDPDGVLYDAVMGGAWLAFIRWACSLPEARGAFTKETGIAWPIAPTSALDVLIDQATGAQDHVLFMFAQWVTVEWWGDLEDAPEAFQVACRERPVARRARAR
jgi:hypothetical protein